MEQTFTSCRDKQGVNSLEPRSVLKDLLPVVKIKPEDGSGDVAHPEFMDSIDHDTTDEVKSDSDMWDKANNVNKDISGFGVIKEFNYVYKFEKHNVGIESLNQTEVVMDHIYSLNGTESCNNISESNESRNYKENVDILDLPEHSNDSCEILHVGKVSKDIPEVFNVPDDSNNDSNTFYVPDKSKEGCEDLYDDPGGSTDDIVVMDVSLDLKKDEASDVIEEFETDMEIKEWVENAILSENIQNIYKNWAKVKDSEKSEVAVSNQEIQNHSCDSFKSSRLSLNSSFNDNDCPVNEDPCKPGGPEGKVTCLVTKETRLGH